MEITDKELSIKDIYCVIERKIKKGRINPRKRGLVSSCIVCVVSGEALYTFADNSFTARKGDVFCLTKGSVYSIDIFTDTLHVIFADFDFNENNAFVSGIFRGKNLEKNFKNLLENWLAKRTAYKLTCISILYGIYAAVFEETIHAHIPENKRRITEAVIDLMRIRFTDSSVNINELAETANISEVHLRRVFRDVYKKSPIQYINDLRIERAKEILRYGEVSITETAVLTGYSDIYYFSRLFKKETGYTPKEYRRMFKSPDSTDN